MEGVGEQLSACQCVFRCNGEPLLYRQIAISYQKEKSNVQASLFAGLSDDRNAGFRMVVCLKEKQDHI